MACCLIGLGANLGDAEAKLHAALRWLERQPEIHRLRASDLIGTLPAGGPAGQPHYVNAAARCETNLAPLAFLELLQECEAQFGRERGETWSPRTLDLDLLLYDQEVLASPRLTLPHPRLAFRRFVLQPAAQIAGELRHPSLRSTLAELLSHVNSAPRYVALASACWFAKQYVVASALTSLKASDVPARTLMTRGITVVGGPLISDPEHSFVEHYCDLLPRFASELREALAQPKQWLISSYWPGELELGAQLWFEGPARDAAAKAYAEAFAGIPSPQLLMYLATPDDLLLFNPELPDRDAAYYEQARRLASQRDALDRHIADVQGVPLLRADASKPEAAIRELSAAVVALTGN